MGIIQEIYDQSLVLPDTFVDADLDIADGEVTIFEVGSADDDYMYIVETIDFNIIATPGILEFKLYKEVNGIITGPLDQLNYGDNFSVAADRTGRFSAWDRQRSRYLKGTVQTDTDNASLTATILLSRKKIGG